MAKIDISASLRRIAWSYGCSKKGSDEEEMLRKLLMEKAALLAAPGSA